MTFNACITVVTGFVQKFDCGFPGQNYFIFQTFQGILYLFI